MEKKILFIGVLVCMLLCGVNVRAQIKSDNIPIGQWREHLSYYQTHSVVKAGEEVLVACPSSMFYYSSKTKKSRSLSKVEGLSDAGVGVIAYDSVSKSTVVAYNNSNVDIIYKGKVYNIPDIKNRFVEGGKEINSIYFSDEKAFLACGFGVVVLDLPRHEIFDTWYVGENSSALKVNNIYSNDTAFFLATKEGLLYTRKDYSVLASSQVWQRQRLDDSALGEDVEVRYVGGLGEGTMIVAYYTGTDEQVNIVKYDGENMSLFKNYSYSPFIKTFSQSLAVGTWDGVDVYDTAFNRIADISYTNHPIDSVKGTIRDVLVDGEDLWVAHEYRGLIYIPGFKSYLNEEVYKPKDVGFPNGPLTTYVYNISIAPQGAVYVAPGGRDALLNNRWVEGNVFRYEYDYWDWFIPIDDGAENRNFLRDIIDIAIDPRDERHLMCASWYNGIVEIENGRVVNVYDSTNTNGRLCPYMGSYRIAAVDYDKSGNLLVAQSLADYNFVFLNYKGEWGAFNTTNFFGGEDQIKGMVEDTIHHYRLIYSYNGKCIIVNNDSLATKSIDINNGSLLKTDKINCMVQDKEGEIWIGTDKGIKVIYSLDNAFQSAGSMCDLECNNVIYDQDGIAQYLLSFEDVQCIMVDGANRKWIGTERNGIYVLSSNGDKELKHYTKGNSPLLSDKIICMAQHPLTGEVFIGTDCGIVSYRAESLPAGEEKQKLVSFPNPVRENYHGTIAIKGFVKDSDVRITDAQGREVAHLKSLGGQAVWDGKNFNGQRVGSGVYYIFSYANNDDKTSKADGKLLIIK